MARTGQIRGKTGAVFIGGLIVVVAGLFALLRFVFGLSGDALLVWFLVGGFAIAVAMFIFGGLGRIPL
ncbi:MAG: hypothetical protein SVU88_00135 [Candidatus Nanohaloarchaea archaeon]|nr:hypothetical protein [Candidatus Nanohaloarchaea archaeon]